MRWHTQAANFAHASFTQSLDFFRIYAAYSLITLIWQPAKGMLHCQVATVSQFIPVHRTCTIHFDFAELLPARGLTKPSSASGNSRESSGWSHTDSSSASMLSSSHQGSMHDFCTFQIWDAYHQVVGCMRFACSLPHSQFTSWSRSECTSHATSTRVCQEHHTSCIALY